MNGWSWSNLSVGILWYTGGACALAGCAVDGPSPIADTFIKAKCWWWCCCISIC